MNPLEQHRCQGWVNPSSVFYGPVIQTLSSFESPAGSSTLVSITGTNFFSYSTVRFGIMYPTVYFINTNTLQFYVPNTLNYGNYPVQVFNGTIGSNIVTYSIDNASGYWYLSGNGSITNTNPGTVTVSALSKGLPVYLDNTSNVYTISNPYVVPLGVNTLICNTNGHDMYITLPSGIRYTGVELRVKSLSTENAIYSTSNNIQPGIPGTYSNEIVAKHSTQPSVPLIYNGVAWILV